MDKVRLGRVLGKGARGAAKSLWEAAEAAAAPDPNAAAKTEARTGSAREAVGRVVEVHRQVQGAKQQVRTAVIAGGKQAGKSALAPVKKFTSVLWLEVTGFFFGIFAVVLGRAAWSVRVGFHAGADVEVTHKAWMYAGLGVLFAYFSVSSFVRARRREKR